MVRACQRTGATLQGRATNLTSDQAVTQATILHSRMHMYTWSLNGARCISASYIHCANLVQCLRPCLIKWNIRWSVDVVCQSAPMLIPALQSSCQKVTALHIQSLHCRSLKGLGLGSRRGLGVTSALAAKAVVSRLLSMPPQRSLPAECGRGKAKLPMRHACGTCQ